MVRRSKGRLQRVGRPKRTSGATCCHREGFQQRHTRTSVRLCRGVREPKSRRNSQNPAEAAYMRVSLSCVANESKWRG
jgi:hypothetical protein